MTCVCARMCVFVCILLEIYTSVKMVVWLFGLMVKNDDSGFRLLRLVLFHSANFLIPLCLSFPICNKK